MANQLPLPAVQSAPPSWWTRVLSGGLQAVSAEQIDRFKRYGESELRTLRPWAQFFGPGRFSRPANFAEIQSRVYTNIGFYRTNYLVVLVCLTCYTLITNLFLLISLGVIATAYFYLKTTPSDVIHIGGIQLTRPQFNIAFAVGTAVLLYISSAYSSIGWLVMASAILIAGHAALAEPAPPEPLQMSEFV